MKQQRQLLLNIQAVDNYLAEGKNMREIAEMKVNQRNMDRINSYIERGDYDNLEKLYERNLLEYGQKEGPTVQQLYEKYGSYEDVVYSSVKVNKGMNVILGIEKQRGALWSQKEKKKKLNGLEKMV